MNDASDSATNTYYSILGVAETATADEIKRAYFHLVRRVRPETDPERYEEFQKAGTVLSDPRKRREYDQLRDAGRRVQILTDQAAAAAEKDPQKAYSLLKAAVALAPDSPRPRLVLAHVLTRLNDFAGAEKQYKRLLAETPMDETLHYRYARCLFVEGRYEDAEKEFAAALRLNPYYHDAHIMLARIYEKTGQFGAAIFSLERAVENDDAEDYADFDALLRLLVLHLRMENALEAERTARRIVAILPATPEDPMRQRDRAVKRMIARARELAVEEQFTAVRALAALGRRLPHMTDDQMAGFAQVGHDARLFMEAKNIQEDGRVPPEIKALADTLYLSQVGDGIREARERDAADAIRRGVARDARSFVTLIEYLRREYPFFALEQEVLLSPLYVGATSRVSSEFNTMPNIPLPESDAPGRATPKERKGLLSWLRGKKQ